MKSGVIRLALIAAAALTLLPVAAHAQWWQRHPAYAHAMSDLREAYWLIGHQDTFNPARKAEEQQAAMEIHAAYMNLKDASIVDQKSIDDQPPPDMTFGDHRARLHRALDLLQDAFTAVNHEEDDAQASGFRHKALDRIADAAAATKAAMRAWNF